MMVEPEKDAAALAERMRMTTRCGDDNVERKVTATASSTLDGTDATTTLQQCKEGVAHTADSKSSHIVDAHPPFVGDVSEEPLPSAKKDDATIGEENDNENDSSSSSSVDDDPGNHFYSIDPNGMVTASSASSTHPASVMLDCNNNNSMDGVEEEGELAETASDIMSRTSSVRSALDATEVRSHAYNLLQRLAGPRAATSGSNETEEPSHVNPNGAKSLPSNGDGLREKRPYSKTTLLCIILSIVVILTGLIVTVAVLARNKKDNGSDESLPDNDVNNPFFPPTVSPAPTTSFETTSTECQSLLERPRVQQFEVEDAVAFLGNGTTSTKTYNNATGYCGSGYGILSDAGDRVVVGYVTTDSSGYYTFTVRYSTSIQAELIVSLNSVPVAFLTMNATKSTGSWTIVTVSNMLLHEGSHYLEVWIQKDHVPNVHIDWIALTNDVPLSKSEYLTQLLKEDYGIDGGMEWHQNASLSWMAMEDTLDWTTVSSRELVERYVLAQFYMATYGEVWNSQAGWLSSRHVCDWYGIICVSTNGTIKTDNLVTDVVLVSNGLFGGLPNQFTLLKDLATLNLNGNQVEGPLRVGSFAKLNALSLQDNFLTGEIPSSIGSISSSLTSLALGNNRLGGTIPLELFLLSNLQVLRLDQNDFTGPLPIEIGQLSSLMELNISHNDLTGTVPPVVSAMPSLQTVEIGHNAFDTSRT